MREIFKGIVKNFKRTGVLQEDVAIFLRMHDCEDTIKHVNTVAEEAKILASRFFESQEDAFSAGLLHDVSVLFPEEDRLKIANELKIDVLPEEKIYPAILHQKISQVMAREIFGITDENVLNAIGCHTTLKENASVLDKIVFISDKIRWDQKYDAPFKSDVSKALDISLDESCFCYLNYLWNRKESLAVVHPWMAAAYRQLGNDLKKFGFSLIYNDDGKIEASMEASNKN
ncbi:MAG: bis(5'-nucleosyl)-tetraphosphatase (symmetrical) YqeK [Parcubacteria group bacterium]|jgi:predicted HD superfamily hydrolase involved in NAD metabolism